MLFSVVQCIGNIILMYVVLLLEPLHGYVIVSWLVLCRCSIVRGCWADRCDKYGAWVTILPSGRSCRTYQQHYSIICKCLVTQPEKQYQYFFIVFKNSNTALPDFLKGTADLGYTRSIENYKVVKYVSQIGQIILSTLNSYTNWFKSSKCCWLLLIIQRLPTDNKLFSIPTYLRSLCVLLKTSTIHLYALVRLYSLGHSSGGYSSIVPPTISILPRRWQLLQLYCLLSIKLMIAVQPQPHAAVICT